MSHDIVSEKKYTLEYKLYMLSAGSTAACESLDQQNCQQYSSMTVTAITWFYSKARHKTMLMKAGQTHRQMHRKNLTASPEMNNHNPCE